MHWRVGTVTVQVTIFEDDGHHLRPGPPQAPLQVSFAELAGSPLYEQITAELARAAKESHDG